MHAMQCNFEMMIHCACDAILATSPCQFVPSEFSSAVDSAINSVTQHAFRIASWQWLVTKPAKASNSHSWAIQMALLGIALSTQMLLSLVP